MAKREFDRVLLVEGADDQHVVYALCMKNDILKNFDVVDCTGIDPLLERIPATLRESDLKAFGAIIDADTNLENRFRQIVGKLDGYAAPTTMPENGLTLKVEGKPRFGLWIMPDNRVPGMLEDFVRFLVPPGDQLHEKAERIIEEIETEDLEPENRFKPIRRSKALIHTWLAWQEEPGSPLGQAITKRYLTADSEAVNRFATWLRELFSEDGPLL